MKNETIKIIEENKIITIIRGVSKEKIVPTVQALYDGGMRLVEVTFDQSGKFSKEYTMELISTLSKEFEGRMCIGAGTVMSEEQVVAAYEAGAKYIISPDTNEAVIRKTTELGLVSIPGSFSPTEAAFAHRCGADFVKMFPAGELGMSYIKAVKAPLSHIKMLAVGGVDEKNLKDFLALGISGVGIGSGVVKKDLIEKGEFDKITELAKAYTTQL